MHIFYRCYIVKNVYKPAKKRGIREMEKVKTFLADISDLLNEKNYQKIYEKVPAFRQEKADRLKHREDQAQSVGAWYLWMKIQERHKIPQDAGQSFNLSHSGKYVLCIAGVSGERVGCDI